MKRVANILRSSAKPAFRALLAVILLLCARFQNAGAQERVKVDGSEYAYDFRIYFPFDDAKFNENYLENPQTLAKLDSVIAVHGIEALDSLLVVAKSSPEGRYAYNMELASRRAQSMGNYLTTRFPGLDGKLILSPGVSPWPASRDKKDLVRLRYAAFRLVFPYDITVPVPEAPEEVIEEPVVPEPVVVVEEEPIQVEIPEQPEKYKTMILALKTNLLYDAVTALNFEVEVPIGKRFSLMWEDVFPWWETGNKYCFQYWEMGAEARYWFKPWDVNGTEKLRGFFVGPYVMSAKYDFQYDRSLNYQGEHWSTGLSAGWCTPIGRKQRCNLELSLALGFMRTDYRGYIPADDYSLLIRNPYDAGTMTYPFGPTKAKVSLVVPINITRSYKGGTK